MISNDFDEPQNLWLLRVTFGDTGPARFVFRSFVAAYEWWVTFIRNNWHAETRLHHTPDDDIVLIDMFCRCGQHKWSIEECVVCF